MTFAKETNAQCSCFIFDLILLNLFVRLSLTDNLLTFRLLLCVVPLLSIYLLDCLRAFRNKAFLWQIVSLFSTSVCHLFLVHSVAFCVEFELILAFFESNTLRGCEYILVLLTLSLSFLNTPFKCHYQWFVLVTIHGFNLTRVTISGSPSVPNVLVETSNCYAFYFYPTELNYEVIVISDPVQCLFCFVWNISCILLS